VYSLTVLLAMVFSGISKLPIVVDLDFTLIKTDSLHEQMVRAFFSAPSQLLAALRTLPQGRAAFKADLNRRLGASDAVFPMREPLLDYLKAQRAKGREIHLCTAAHQSVAESVGAQAGIFTSVQGSLETNLKGGSKAAHLAGRFPEGHVYAGDSAADLAVWERASGVILAGASPRVTRRARALDKPVEAEFPPEGPSVRDWLRQLRVHHWTKNVLLFAPLVLAHAFDVHSVLAATGGLTLLLMVTSSTYVINDLADLQADRKHWTKRNRPIAAGRIRVMTASSVAAVGLFGGLALSLLLPWRFTLSLAAYACVTLAYSAGLKRIPLFDALIIAALFTLRLIMGATVTDVPFSVWLFTFSMSFFFSLAIAKRYTELLRARENGVESLDGRGYKTGDASLAMMFGGGAGLASLQVLVLYLVEDAYKRVPYAHPEFLWLAPMLVAIWLGRIWLLAHRGRMHDDPVSFAVRDKVSLALGAGLGLAFWAAL
jgi:4-hydroxybenzoate polyprenyltransferase